MGHNLVIKELVNLAYLIPRHHKLFLKNYKLFGRTIGNGDEVMV